MNVRTARTLLSASLVLAAAIPRASAGVVIEFEHRFPTDKAPLPATARLDPDRLRIDFANRTIIYREDKGLVWLVDPAAGRYTELTKEQLKVLGQQVAALRTQLQERLKGLPPDQRAAAEQMLGEAGGSSIRSAGDLQKTGKTETINGFRCDGYEDRRAGGTPRQLWIADWKASGVQASDLAVLQRFGEFLSEMGTMAEKLAIGLAQTYSGPGALPGLPIRVVTPFGSGELVDEVKTVRRTTIPADMYELPPGVTPQAAGGAHHSAAPPAAPGSPASPKPPAPAAPAPAPAPGSSAHSPGS